MIKQEHLFKKLGLIIAELNDQYQFLAQNPQQLNELELDLFHANAVFLADHVQIIKKINQNSVLPETTINEPQPSEIQKIEPLFVADSQTETSIETAVLSKELVVEASYAEERDEEERDEEELVEEERYEEERYEEEQPSVIEFDITDNKVFKEELPAFEFILAEDDQSDKFDFEEKHVDELFNRPLSEEEQRILAEKRKLMEENVDEELDLIATDDEEIGPEPFLVYKAEATQVSIDQPSATAPENEITLEANSTNQPTLNDLLASKLTDSSINATTNSGISDLKQAINLNDKLLYIKDLFNGYNLAYAEAIDFANKLPNFEAADAFFKKNYAVKNNWAAKQTTVDKFYELLNQRFK